MILTILFISSMLVAGPMAAAIMLLHFKLELIPSLAAGATLYLAGMTGLLRVDRRSATEVIMQSVCCNALFCIVIPLVVIICVHFIETDWAGRLLMVFFATATGLASLIDSGLDPKEIISRNINPAETIYTYSGALTAVVFPALLATLIMQQAIPVALAVGIGITLSVLGCAVIFGHVALKEQQQHFQAWQMILDILVCLSLPFYVLANNLLWHSWSLNMLGIPLILGLLAIEAMAIQSKTQEEEIP